MRRSVPNALFALLTVLCTTGVGALAGGCSCERTVVPPLPLETDAELPPMPGPDAGFFPAAPEDIASMYVDSLCPALAHARCVSAVSCQCPSAPAPAAGCEADAEAACREVEALIREDLAGEDRVISEALLDACRETLEAAADACIGPDLSALHACRRWIVSPTPVGGSCPEGFGGACANGAGYCGPLGACLSLPFHAGEACTSSCGRELACVDGTCQAPRSTGGDCDAHDDCAPPNLCLEGHCQTARLPLGSCEEGAACPVGFACEGGVCARAPTECQDYLSCEPDQYCRPYEPRHCMARPSLGEPCLSVTDCEADAYCDIALERPICKARPEVDQACAQPGGICAEGLACVRSTTEQVCVVPVALDGACQAHECSDGLHCLDGRCRPLPGPGESCTGTTCAGELTCEGVGQTCVEKGRLGQECNVAGYSRACEADLICGDDGRCVMAPGDGEPCTVGCRGEAWCSLVDGNYRCVSPAPRGAPCVDRCAAVDEYCGYGPGECLGTLCRAADISG